MVADNPAWPAPKNPHRVELATMTHTIELQPVQVPNFVRPVAPVGKRQDGFKELPAIPVSDLSVDTLEAVCAEFRRGLFEKAGKAPNAPELTGDA